MVTCQWKCISPTNRPWCQLNYKIPWHKTNALTLVPPDLIRFSLIPCLQCSSMTHMVCTYKFSHHSWDSCSKKECTTDVQHSGWRCLLLRNLRWHRTALTLRTRGQKNSSRKQVSLLAVLHQILTLHSTEMDRQNNFIARYIVEISKPYRMVLESWKSVQAHFFLYHFFASCIFRPRSECMRIIGCRGAHTHLLVIQQVLIDSRRVDLPFGLCLEQ